MTRFSRTVRWLAALSALTSCARLYERTPSDDGSFGSVPDTSPLPALRVPTLPSEAATRPPAPISGGTLTLVGDGQTAVAADPDLDALWIAPLSASSPPLRVRLAAGDEPGRVAEGAAGIVYVALRRGGAVVAVDSATGRIVWRTAVCGGPRGITWDAAADVVRVACADGDFVSLTPLGAVSWRTTLVPDLRDVLIAGDAVFVTTMRDALVYRVRGDGVAESLRPGGHVVADAQRQTHVAWRTLAANGQIIMLAQHATTRPLDDSGADGGRGYGSALAPTVMPGIGWMDAPLADAGPPRDPFAGGVLMALQGGLAVDVAVTADAPTQIALASPGWAWGQGPAQVQVFDGSALGEPSRASLGVVVPTRALAIHEGQAIAVTFTHDHRVVAQTRNPSALVVEGSGGTTRRIMLTTEATGDTGFDVFHAVTPSGLACATCHPEGADDGNVWSFTVSGTRRTPPVSGGVSTTAPFHWSGDIGTLGHLAQTVFTRRMHGPSIDEPTVAALGRWLDTVPSQPGRPRDDAAARGEAIFRSTETGCATCHAGPQFTNHETVDVGTGGSFQVPRLLGLGARAPYMHSGCASTLAARFTDASCGGGEQHGHTSQLSEAQLHDLIAYLKTL